MAKQNFSSYTPRDKPKKRPGKHKKSLSKSEKNIIDIKNIKARSVIKVVLLMVLCSEIAANDCKIIPTPQVLFDDYSSCIVYGYDYSHTLMASFDPEWTNSR